MGQVKELVPSVIIGLASVDQGGAVVHRTPRGALRIVTRCEGCRKRALVGLGTHPTSSAETSYSIRTGSEPRAAPIVALLGCRRRQARRRVMSVGRGLVRGVPRQPS